MDQRKKRPSKIRGKIRNVPLREFESIIKQHGYIEEGGKHPKAIIGTYTMPYKRENPIKSCYVKELYDMIDSL